MANPSTDRKLYAERDIMEQGQVYCDHVNAMTAEGLHGKSEIAAELAQRDIEIGRLREELSKRAFHHGTVSGFTHIEYCDFCNYSREWIVKHGHDSKCLLRVADDVESAKPPV